MTVTFEATRAGYAKLWNEAAVKPGADDQHANTFADKIIANEARYRAVQATTGVPWYFIAALHMRESSCNFDGVLHNGEHIIGTGRETTLVPAGRGPFSTWEESAVDALKLKGLQRVQDWSIERMLYSAEVYNGLGYFGKINSPYVWAGTTDEQTGKYIRDHVFDASVDDPQLGVAAILKRLAERRPDIAAALQTGHTVAQAAEKPHEGEIIVAPPPQPGAAAAQPGATAGDILPTLIRILTVLQALMSRQGDLSALLGQVAARPTAPPSKLERPGVQLGVASFFAGLAAQLTGTVGPPQGLDTIVNLVTSPTVAGTLTTLLPIATAALSATGAGGAVAAGILKIVGPMVMSAAQSAKTKQGQ